MKVDRRVDDLDVELVEKDREERKGTGSNTGYWTADMGSIAIWFVWAILVGDNFIIRWLIASGDGSQGYNHLGDF
jgi:hypothetical protein